MSTASRRSGGFTLAELLITLLIAAVLAAIAVPSYRQFVLRSHRVEAKSALLNVATEQEKYYLQRNRYANDGELVKAPVKGGLGFTRNTENGWYSLAVTADDDDNPQEWTVAAQAEGNQRNDSKCKYFSIDSAGNRTAGPNLDGSGTTADTSRECWQK